MTLPFYLVFMPFSLYNLLYKLSYQLLQCREVMHKMRKRCYFFSKKKTLRKSNTLQIH